MKIAFLLNSVSRDSGGLFDICRRLGQTLAARDEVAVLGIRDRFTDADLPEWEPLRPKVFPPLLPGSFGVARGYARALSELAPDLAHVQALWIYPSLAGYRWHRKTGKPFMYTAHGMLDPWAVQNSGWKKQIVRTLWENAAHRSAACFQVNSEAEYQSVRKFGLTNSVCIIPNGMDVVGKVERRALARPDVAEARRERDWQGPNQSRKDEVGRGRKTLLYLGRLHPKKNLGALLSAWRLAVNNQQVTDKRWELVIAGWDQGGYEDELKRMKEELGIRDSVSFAGPLFGDDKAAAYLNADAFILPSLSEGLPMVVLEAWAYAKPVLMTPECNIPEGFGANAALQIGTTPETIASGLNRLFEMSDTDRLEMGERGRALVETKSPWARIGEQMRAVYQWVLGGGTPPDCVRLK